LTVMTGAGSGGADLGARSGWPWDVALSFASAQRDYVERVAAALKARGVRCFYDADEQIDLWGKYLAEELPIIYGEQAAAVVVFVSADYAARDWTLHERRAAVNRAVTERREYVLPARFDNTPLPGLLSDMVAVDLRTRTPQQFADRIVAKLTALNILAIAAPTIPDVDSPFHWNAELVVTARWIGKLAALKGLKKFSQGYGKTDKWMVRLSLSEKHVLYLAPHGGGKTYCQVVRLDGTEVYRGEPLPFYQFEVRDGHQSRTLRLTGLKRSIWVADMATWSIEVDGRDLLEFTGWIWGMIAREEARLRGAS
jgi:hypothetical protein